MWRPLSDSI